MPAYSRADDPRTAESSIPFRQAPEPDLANENDVFVAAREELLRATSREVRPATATVRSVC